MSGEAWENMSDPVKAFTRGMLFCLFMTLQGEIKNIKISSENVRGAS